MTPLTLLGFIVPWAVLSVGCWIGYQLIRQNGRVLLRLEALEQHLETLKAAVGANAASPSPPSAGSVAAAPPPSIAPPAPPSGLPIGSPAPQFELPDLSGVRHSLSEWRGRRVLLVFFNPQCGFCTQMASDLAAMPVDGVNGNPIPLVVSTGDAGANRQLVTQYGLRGPMLLQQQMEVASQYLVGGTPMGYVLDEQGRVASQLAVGSQALLQLVGRAAPSAAVAPPPAMAPPSGLALGSPAPQFELPDLAGVRHSLSEWRGRRVLLVFFNPQCGFCTQMASDLAALPIEGANGNPVPLVVTTGDAGTNRQLVAQHGLPGPVLLQQQMEVASQYLVGGTPMGYVLDEQGLIASQLAVGSQALLQLVGGPRPAAPAAPAHEPQHKGNRPLSESKIERQGLAAGTSAPGFQLSRVGGGELSLEQYRGQRVLLVFSDPHCGPCDALAPKLEQLHRQRPDLQVLMVSRGAAEENRRKVAQLGLNFPVVLQGQWEISRLYAMFATPVGYLIDEGGVIAADVAVGTDAILALANQQIPKKELVRQ